MPRTSFGFGTPITPEFLNKVAYPKITGLAEDGNLDLITNAQLLNQPGQVIFDLYDRIDRLKGSQFGVSGLVLSVKGVRMLDPFGVLLTIATQNITIPDNGVFWVWLDATGTYRTTNFNPPAGIRSARVTTGSGLITSVVDLRYDYLWLPNAITLPVFGGNATTDYTAAIGTTILSGVINCKDFTVPVGATIDVDGSLTIRASGTATVLGTIKTRTTPVRVENGGAPVYGHSNGGTQLPLGSSFVDSRSTPITNRDKARSFGGSCIFNLTAITSAIGRATFCTFSSAVPTVFGSNGAVLTINSAGPLRLAPTAVINCSAISNATLTIPATSLSLFGAGLGATETWTASVSIIPPQPTAGSCVLQSSTSILVEALAAISAVGANKSQGLTYQNSVTNNAATVITTANFFSVGGGGGGNIHFQSPTVSSSPSAVFNVAAGSHVVVGGESVINGPGSGGSGFQSVGSVLPTAGSITTVQAAPIEF